MQNQLCNYLSVPLNYCFQVFFPYIITSIIYRDRFTGEREGPSNKTTKKKLTELNIEKRLFSEVLDQISNVRSLSLSESPLAVCLFFISISCNSDVCI